MDNGTSSAGSSGKQKESCRSSSDGVPMDTSDYIESGDSMGAPEFGAPPSSFSDIVASPSALNASDLNGIFLTHGSSASTNAEPLSLALIPHFESPDEFSRPIHKKVLSSTTMEQVSTSNSIPCNSACSPAALYSLATPLKIRRSASDHLHPSAALPAPVANSRKRKTRRRQQINTDGVRSQISTNGVPPKATTNRLPRATPYGFSHYLIDRHPWAHFVNPRPLRMLKEPFLPKVTTKLDTTKYRHLPDCGYMWTKFNESLFPQVMFATERAPAEIPFIELQHLEDAIAFRARSQQVISALLEGTYTDIDVAHVEQTSPTYHPYITVPPTRYGYRPVLYQVVSTGWGTGVVLEAKDFFTVGPDRRDLHCITLDQYAIEVLMGKRGFNKSRVSVKDFIWVYDVKPTLQALNAPDATLQQSRMPRITALDYNLAFFFRASHFAFVTPVDRDIPVYGMILSINSHGNNKTTTRAAFEGCPEAVTITPSLSDFPLTDLSQYEIVTAHSRVNVSSAMRFSEPPVSLEARSQLVQLARQFWPMHPEEGIIPLKIFKAPVSEFAWFEDRLGQFDNYHIDPEGSKLKLAKVCNAACSALAAVSSADDDRRSHWVVATVTTPTWFPLSLQFILLHTSSGAGWAPHRPAVIWVSGSNQLVQVTVVAVDYLEPQNALHVVVQAFSWSHSSLSEAVTSYARNDGFDTVVDICVRLGRSTAAATPIYDLVSHAHIFGGLHPASTGNKIVDIIFAKQTLGTSDEPYLRDRIPSPDAGYSFSVGDRNPTLTPDQKGAVRIGTQKLPIVAIQAAFGTGKTLVGALISAISAVASGITVIVTASTNAAVAQFTETLLSLNDFPTLTVVRHISDTAEADDLSPTPVDLNKILKTLGDDSEGQLCRRDRRTCTEFKQKRQLLENYFEHPNLVPEMSDNDKEEYKIAEQYVSSTLKHMVRIMFSVRRPSVICMTTTSLLNSTAEGSGIFAPYVDTFQMVIGDDSSQIPEPALLTIIGRLKDARHVYIGDVHQLAPHARCPHDSNPVLHGARSVLSVLLRAPAVPVASLVTTFRAHPALIELPNRIAYKGALISETSAESRQMLLSVMDFPTSNVPFMFIDVDAESTRAASKSHFNEFEALACMNFIEQLINKGISPECICVISFYKEQYRQMKDRLDEINVEIATVDTIQGCEKEIVITLTTKTNFSSDEASFLDDYRRVNVAITRCRQGQFIFGKATSLRWLPTWGRVLKWANLLNAVVRPDEINRYLRLPQ